jgi:hypothetical protein
MARSLHRFGHLLLLVFLIDLLQQARQVDLDGRTFADFAIDLYVSFRLLETVDLTQAEPAVLAYAFVEKNGSNAWSTTSFGIPVPLSETAIITY